MRNGKLRHIHSEMVVHVSNETHTLVSICLTYIREGLLRTGYAEVQAALRYYIRHGWLVQDVEGHLMAPESIRIALGVPSNQY